jgi:hypothetical protein
MDSLHDAIKEYTRQLESGYMQKAYCGIMAFLSELKTYLERLHSDYTYSALYPGYMDMTYFAFTPSGLARRNLKIAIVFLHKTCTFEIWLAGRNRQIQAQYIALLNHTDLGTYTLSQVQPGVDSILTSVLIAKPDFDHTDELKKQIATKTEEFVKDITAILEST